MCRVSIILPTYNRRYCIQRAIDSVLSQTWQDYELIIIDDGSTDGTEEYICSLTDKRIKYVRLGKNSGVARARNIGIENAAGEYIAFQDSDAEWGKNKLEKQVYCLDSSKQEVAMVYSPYKRIYRDYAIVYPALNVPLEEKSGQIIRYLLEHPLVDTPTMLVRKNVLYEVGGFDPVMSALEDYELSIRIAERYQIHIIDEILVLSYDNEDSISNNAASYIRNSFYLLKKYREVFAKYDMMMPYLNQLSQYAVENHQLEFYVECLQEFIGK